MKSFFSYFNSVKAKLFGFFRLGKLADSGRSNSIHFIPSTSSDVSPKGNNRTQNSEANTSPCSEASFSTLYYSSSSDSTNFDKSHEQSTPQRKCYDKLSKGINVPSEGDNNRIDIEREKTCKKFYKKSKSNLFWNSV